MQQTQSKGQKKIGFWKTLILGLIIGSIIGWLSPKTQAIETLTLILVLGFFTALICPKNRFFTTRKSYFGAIMGIFLVMVFLQGQEIKRMPASSPSQVAQAPSSDASKETQQTIWIERSKEGVRKRMKDPASTQFRNVFFNESDGTPVVCGEVNGKNSYGG